MNVDPEAPEPGTSRVPAGAPTQFSPLSIQAASLVRSIESLSNIFWISIAGTFLSVFFAGLAQLESNAVNDFISLGEYQVPKSILPLASLTFAMFAFWLTANRLNMLAFVLQSSRLDSDMVHEIFHLNPPVLQVFDTNNAAAWSPFSGVSVLAIIWSVFFGNSIALTWSSAVQQGASLAEFDLPLLLIYAILTVAVLTYGVRTIVPPLRHILLRLHNVEFHVGWKRGAIAVALVVAVFVANHIQQINSVVDQPDDLLGPAIANAIDGETLFLRGIEVNLFGIDAVEPGQQCQTADGADYACGRAATQALQQLVQNEQVVCVPLFSIAVGRVVGLCEVTTDDEPVPMKPGEFIAGGYRPNNLSRLMVVQGHALSVGLGGQLFGEEQSQAQTLRVGVWQGSFVPPWRWRSDR